MCNLHVTFVIKWTFANLQQFEDPKITFHKGIHVLSLLNTHSFFIYLHFQNIMFCVCNSMGNGPVEGASITSIWKH